MNFVTGAHRNTGADFNQSIEAQTVDIIRVSDKFLPFNSSENKSLVKTKFQSPAAQSDSLFYACTFVYAI